MNRFRSLYGYLLVLCIILLTACSSTQYKPIEKQSTGQHTDHSRSSRTVTLAKGAEIKEKVDDFDSESKHIDDDEIQGFLQQFFDAISDGNMKALTSNYLDSAMNAVNIAFIENLVVDRSAQIIYNSSDILVENERDRSKLLYISTHTHLSHPQENVPNQIFYLVLVEDGESYKVKEFYYPNSEDTIALEDELARKYEEAQSSEDTITIFKPDDDSTGGLEIDRSDDSNMSSIKKIVQNNDHKVFKIFASNDEYEVTGSGFFIDKGIIVTNFHVIADMTEGYLQLTDETVYEFEGVIAGDPLYDLAVIKLKEEAGSPVRIGDPSAVEKGDDVVAIGSPLGIINTVSVGIISNIWTIDGVNQFQISVPIDHGSSGGALFNMKGEVIGITSAGIAESGADLNFAVSIEYVDEFLEEYADTPFDTIESITLEELFAQ